MDSFNRPGKGLCWSFLQQNPDVHGGKTDRAQQAYTQALSTVGIRAMIEKNLGNLERIVRLAMGVCFAIWTIAQPTMNGIEWLVMIVSMALILNGVFSRCYLWFILDIDSRSEEGRTRHTGAC
jgi:hypothetical protein